MGKSGYWRNGQVHAPPHSTIGDVMPNEFINNHQDRPHAADQNRRALGMIPKGSRA